LLSVELLELFGDTPAVEAVGELPADQRAAVLAHHVDDESYAEIARRLASPTKWATAARSRSPPPSKRLRGVSPREHRGAARVA
jgi:hypothetical protein